MLCGLASPELPANLELQTEALPVCLHPVLFTAEERWRPRGGARV